MFLRSGQDPLTYIETVSFGILEATKVPGNKHSARQLTNLISLFKGLKGQLVVWSPPKEFHHTIGHNNVIILVLCFPFSSFICLLFFVLDYFDGGSSGGNGNSSNFSLVKYMNRIPYGVFMIPNWVL